MGFLNFLKQVFSLNPGEDPELQKLREKHGIVIDEKEERKPGGPQNRPGEPDYDVWEDLRNYRMNFFFGNWITRRFRPIGEDKLKKDLEELERKKKEKEEKTGDDGG